MSAQIIDGRRIAAQLKERLRADVATLKRRDGAIGLATLMVGQTYAAAAYERRLQRLTSELGVPHWRDALPAAARQTDVIGQLAELNAEPTVSGILVLRPLPPSIDEATVFQAIDPRKDIESVHPENAGLLALGAPRYVPATAAAAFHVLDVWLDSVGEDREDFYRRSHIVVVGRSSNVGKPAVALAYDRQATVESLDEWASRTGRLGRHTRRADVLIVAAGQPGLIKAEHVNENAVVIDVGINFVTGPGGKTILVGDVDHESVVARARALTPVPGGLGPVTDVWLLHNTVLAAQSRVESSLQRPIRTAS